MESMNPKSSSRVEAGYSLIELIVVVGLIVVMAAVSIPNIVGYTRNYRVRGATNQIASELNTARNRAISRNTNAGISFRVYDSDTYRIFEVPMAGMTAPAGTLGTLRTLPTGVAFVTGAGAPVSGVAFDRLGRPCAIDSGAPCPSLVQTGLLAACTEPECNNRGPADNYVGLNAGTFTITVIEEQTQIRRTVTIAPGGRVLSQR